MQSLALLKWNLGALGVERGWFQRQSWESCATLTHPSTDPCSGLCFPDAVSAQEHLQRCLPALRWVWDGFKLFSWVPEWLKRSLLHPQPALPSRECCGSCCSSSRALKPCIYPEAFQHSLGKVHFKNGDFILNCLRVCFRCFGIVNLFLLRLAWHFVMFMCIANTKCNEATLKKTKTP